MPRLVGFWHHTELEMKKCDVCLFICQSCTRNYQTATKNMKLHFTFFTLQQFNNVPLLQPIAQDYPGKPISQETFTHSNLSWSSIILYLLPLSTTIDNILPVQFMCLTVFLHNLSPSPPWSTSCSGTLHFIHFFIQSLSFCNTCPYQRNLLCCSTEIMSPNNSLSLNSLFETLSFTLMPYTHLTILISTCWSATLFSFCTGRLSLPCNILLCT